MNPPPTPASAPETRPARSAGGALPSLLGTSEVHRIMLRRLRELVAADHEAVVLVGETGTGKSLVAREFHRLGGRRHRPFLLLPCGTLPAAALEEELFGSPGGHFPGAFVLASGGTIHLDDADRLPPSLVHRLRRRGLRERGIGGRVGSTEFPALLLSSRRSVRGVGEDDLWEPFPSLTLPPLRQRGDDVELLARAFLRAWAAARSAPVPELEADALAALHEHPWPGNVRELRDTVERAAETAPGTRIREEHLRIRTRETRPLQGHAPPAVEMIRIPPEGTSLERVEAEVVRATLRITGGNRSQAARILGVSRPTLARKMKLYDAEHEGRR